MLNRGKVWIIPNDDIIQPLYFSEVSNGVSHIKALQEFSNIYRLGMNFSMDDYQQAPIDISKLGHLVIKSDDDSKILIFYIPEIITDRQLEFFQNNEMTYSNTYPKIGGYVIDEDNVDIKHGILEIRTELIKKNKNKKHI